MKKIRVGAVSYLNTKPLLYGIEKLPGLADKMEITTDYPAKIAERLLSNKIDMGLVPVAVIPKMKEWHIYTDYCIGAEGDVASVCLFSKVPLLKIEKVMLDYQSRTSVALGKILLKHLWKIQPELENTSGDFGNNIKGTSAAIMIGDRALRQRNNCPFIYDLAGGWQQLTGLPFVFAAWIANKELPQHFVDEFNAANQVGLTNLDAVLAQNPFADYDLRFYYTQNISYQLTAKKLEAMNLFLSYTNQTVPEAIS